MKERVVLDIPVKLVQAIDRAVDRDIFATNRRAFIVNAINEKIKEINGLFSPADSYTGKKPVSDTPPLPASEPDDGYILPVNWCEPLSNERNDEERKKTKFCREMIRYLRYEDRPITLQEITKHFQFSFSAEMVEDQLVNLEKEGILFKIDQDTFKLTR